MYIGRRPVLDIGVLNKIVQKTTQLLMSIWYTQYLVNLFLSGQQFKPMMQIRFKTKNIEFRLI